MSSSGPLKLNVKTHYSGVECCRSVQCLITARAEIRYCLPEVGIGVEFIGLPEDAQQAIAEEAAGAAPETRR